MIKVKIGAGEAKSLILSLNYYTTKGNKRHNIFSMEANEPLEYSSPLYFHEI